MILPDSDDKRDADLETMRHLLRLQQERRPLMTEEDAVKFVFQGMLGAGHLIATEEAALERLHAEMRPLHPDGDEPLTEDVSLHWFRLNLRAVKAAGMRETDIAHMVCRSAEKRPLLFTRRDVFLFCVKLDGSERMRAAAERILVGAWLPSHSERYRMAYRPAYRVLHRDFRPFISMIEEVDGRTDGEKTKEWPAPDMEAEGHENPHGAERIGLADNPGISGLILLERQR